LDHSGLDRPGTGVLKVDSNVVATKRMERTLPMILQWDESFDIGFGFASPKRSIQKRRRNGLFESRGEVRRCPDTTTSPPRSDAPGRKVASI
jgi:hypothetical protein